MTTIAPRASVLTPATNGTSANSVEYKPRKRQKVIAACDNCRDRKVKCDGLQPVCTPCTKRYGPSAACNWGYRKGRSKMVPMEELVRLQRRIDMIENPKGYTISANEQTTNPMPVRDAPCNAKIANDTNAMMGLMQDGNTISALQYGDSSATSFMTQIRDVVNQQITPSDSQISPSPPRAAAGILTGKQLSEQRAALDYVLPPRRKADHLLQTYWQLSGTLYPFLDTDAVEAWYRTLWTGEDLDDDGPLNLCLLNVMFSIASLMDPATEAQDRVSAADGFYQRAQKLLDFDSIQNRSVLTVQCFLLLGQYLQSTNKPQQCWVFIGLAIRIAQSLRLDLPSQIAETRSSHHRDLLRRVWHGCVFMDRTLSMIFGRPAMITSQAAASVPLPEAHTFGTHCGCFAELYGADKTANDSHFFVEALKLYELMSETVLTLYDSATKVAPDDDVYVRYFGSLGAKALGNVLAMDKKLFQWRRALPLHLQYRLTDQKAAIHQRQTNILWLKHRHIRILLYRPVLSWFCSNHEAYRESLEETLPWKMALQCSVSCVQTAFETIDFFHTWLSTNRPERLDDYLPAWWYSVFYIYTAATAVVGAQIHPAIIAEVGQKCINDTWHKVLKALERFQIFNSHAKRCAAAVTMLFEKVPQQHHEQQQLWIERNAELVEGHHRVPGPKRTGFDSPSCQSRELHSDNHPLCTTHNSDGTSRDLMSIVDPACDSTFTQNVSGMADSALALNYLYPDNFDTSNLDYDLGDMSWLSSVPLQLYRS